MNKIISTIVALIATTTIYAGPYRLTVKDTRYQTITGFGAACF